MSEQPSPASGRGRSNRRRARGLRPLLYGVPLKLIRPAGCRVLTSKVRTSVLPSASSVMTRRSAATAAWITRAPRGSDSVMSVGIAEAGGSVEEVSLDGPEPLAGGAVDLGAIATEFLILAIDPYPRKPGAVFEPPDVGDDSDQPFAALAALKKRG